MTIVFYLFKHLIIKYLHLVLPLKAGKLFPCSLDYVYCNPLFILFSYKPSTFEFKISKISFPLIKEVLLRRFLNKGLLFRTLISKSVC